MTKAKPHPVEEWLGDNHGLTAEQVRTLTDLSDDLARRFPGPDGRTERDAILSAAHRVMIEPTVEVVADFGVRLTQARLEQRAVLLALEYLASTVVETGNQGKRDRGPRSPTGFARLAGVDVMTVRKWRGL